MSANKIIEAVVKFKHWADFESRWKEMHDACASLGFELINKDPRYRGEKAAKVAKKATRNRKKV